MKIMHLLKHAARGNGHVHVAVDLACAQADSGHEVWFASARGSYDDLLRSHGVTVHDLPEPTGKRALLKNAAAMLSLTRRVRPNIMHAHMMSSAVAAYPVARLCGSTLVTTVHNSFDGHSRLMRLGSLVIAVSDAERRLLIDRGFPSRKVVTILNGANGSPREALPVDWIGDLHQPSIISLSGLHQRKAVDDILRAFHAVSTEFPKWHLHVVGSGPDEEMLRRSVGQLQLQDNVHFMGSTLTPRYLLDQADIFISASLADPCPLTTTEARGSGCAIIGTSVGGVPEVLEHGKAGQLVPPRSPDALAGALRRLMADRSELALWRKRSLAGADHFTLKRVAQDHEAAYGAAMQGRRRP